MKKDRINSTFFNFSDSNFSHPDLFPKINDEIVNFARLAAVSSEDYGSFKTSTFASYKRRLFIVIM